MNLRLTNLLIFVFFAIYSNSQEKQPVITGKIFSFNESVNNVHIINLNDLTGTISNDNGEFEIKVHLNDTILFSSIQYEKIKIAVTKKHLNSKIMEISLIPSINNLDEVFLHGLTGNLNLDLAKKPKDTMPKHNFVFKLSDLDKKLPDDKHGFLKSPNAQDITDPIKMNGAGGSATIPDYYMIGVRKLKRELKNKKDFPSKIIKDLGINYFTNNLKIPEEKINHFLAYCEYKNIIEEYNKNNLLEVIKILREESILYHKIEK
ncbi:carboxypeptidase-like regulatory domain-containing protein [uncultured Lutibacter sp.]|uniref:carboxypeptidase-like regulatory domain-containing protein n=1 Tax=uncultured Lutibacter sp. TaxID=437739 RepID=UPI002601638B|nr:carboxypeptidase-like regulatory domain-containing protein [uncultured Lutibacter sp.]